MRDKYLKDHHQKMCRRINKMKELNKRAGKKTRYKEIKNIVMTYKSVENQVGRFLF